MKSVVDFFTAVSSDAPPAPDAEPHADKRASVRHKFKGTRFGVRLGKKRLEIRLKDLSCGGAAGLFDEPVSIGDYIIIEFDNKHHAEARICWVRRALVGVRFVSRLSPDYVSRLHEAQLSPEERQRAPAKVSAPPDRA